jgi:hypothetical protein
LRFRRNLHSIVLVRDPGSCLNGRSVGKEAPLKMF